MFLCSNVSADMYKCDIAGKTTYQDEPCEKRGGTGHKLKKKYEISKEKQKQAKAKLDLEEARVAEQEQLEFEMQQKAEEENYKIRLEEEKVLAAQEYAEQMRRQADAIEQRNHIESKKRSNHYWHQQQQHNDDTQDWYEPPSIQPKHDKENEVYQSHIGKSTAFVGKKQNISKHAKPYMGSSIAPTISNKPSKHAK